MQGKPGRVLAALADPNARMACARAFTDAGWEALTTGDGREAIELLRAYPTDALVLQFPLKVYDGLEVLRRIPREGLYVAPGVVLSVHAGMEGYAQRAMEMGAARSLGNRAPLQEFIQACANINAQDRLYAAYGREAQIDRLLDKLSFPKGHAGTEYLKTALEYALSDGRLLRDLSHGLYPLTGARHGAQAQQVERGIRHAIEKAWMSGPAELQYALFENTIDERRGKPTNAGMIARAAELMRKKEGIV